jgi:DNA-binding response OmpR family regulator
MRLLIVEDDPDGRDMLAELFRMHDWIVTAVATASEAMRELRDGGFDLIISDENLEGESGSSMLRDACAAGLLGSTGALMYTAQPGRLDVPFGVRVLRKPMAIGTILNEARAAAPERTGARTNHPPSSGERPRADPRSVAERESSQRLLQSDAGCPPSRRAR